jgi:hypothetical protein
MPSRIATTTIGVIQVSTHLIGAQGQKTGLERRQLRLFAVPAAALASVGVWVVAEAVFNVNLRQPAFGSARAPQDLGAPFGAVVSAFAALVGWATLSVLERFSARAHRVWPAVAAVVLLLSLGAPLSGHGVSSANRLSLVLMHLAVGAVVIALLSRSSSRRRPSL